MSQKTLYTCDICHTQKDYDQIYGVYHLGCNKFEYRKAHECNTHICTSCRQQFKALEERK